MREFKHNINTIKSVAAKGAKVGYRTIKDFEIVDSHPFAASNLCTVYQVKFSSEGRIFKERLYIWSKREYTVNILFRG